MKKKFTYKDSLYRKYLFQFKATLFNLLTVNSLPLFLRGRDVISTDPQVFGHYELRIKKFIDHFAQNGYSDYLIDIGANIGLSSCQSGNLFQEVHRFEPNPDCFNILKVNTRIALTKSSVFLYNFDLGNEADNLTLHVPKGNWGGGFIHDKFNLYTDNQIGSKDGFDGFDLKNYNEVPIKIESSIDKLTSLFQSLSLKELTSCFIKVDVEGYEPLIIKSNADVIPVNFKAIVLFECWSRDFDPEPLLQAFRGRAQAFKLVRSPEKHIPRLRRLFEIIRQFGYKYELKDFSMRSNSADLVFIVKNN